LPKAKKQGLFNCLQDLEWRLISPLYFIAGCAVLP